MLYPLNVSADMTIFLWLISDIIFVVKVKKLCFEKSDIVIYAIFCISCSVCNLFIM